MPKPEKRGRPTFRQMHIIRRILCRPSDSIWLRCPHKRSTFVRQCEKNGDFTHSARDHAFCDICRCRNVAGHGTHGDFYGIGENTGHYGVGFCVVHEYRIGKKQGWKFAMNQMNALQAFGSKHDPIKGELVHPVSPKDLELASKYVDIRNGLDHAVQCLTLIKDHFEKRDELTERGHKGEPMPMTDATYIKLSMEMAKTVAEVLKKNADLSKERMISVDELMLRLDMEIKLMWRYIGNDEGKMREFLGELMAVWKPVLDKHR